MNSPTTFSAMPCFTILLIVFAAVFIGVMIGRRIHGRRVSVPSCGKCGYQVEGLEALRCPECGNDLRIVGIKTPSAPRPIGPVASAIIWTILLPAPALIITNFVSRAVPRHHYLTMDITLGMPLSQAYQGVHISASGEQANGQWQPESLTLALQLADGSMSPKLVVNLPDWKYTVEGSDSSLESGLDNAVDQPSVLSWMATQGLDTNNIAIENEARSIIQQVQALAAGNSSASRSGFNSVSMGSSTRSMMPRWFGLVALTTWLIVWGVGLLVVTRYAKRIARRTLDNRRRFADPPVTRWPS